MKRGINKKLTIAIITLLSVLLFSAVSILFVNVIDSKKDKNIIVKPQAYDMAGGIDDETYKNTNFEINHVSTLMYFSTIVASGRTFEGKNVYLPENGVLDFAGSGYSWCGIGAKFPYGSTSSWKSYEGSNPFMGTFDGRGCTVKNLSCGFADGDCGYIGFFSKIEKKAVIKNVQIDGFSIILRSNNAESSIGGIVGRVDGVYDGDEGAQIQNCSVKNFTVDSNNKNCYIGGIVGGSIHKKPITTGRQYKLKISNCYIENFKVKNAEDPNSYTTGSAAKQICNIGPAISYLTDGFLIAEDWVVDYNYDVSNCIVKGDVGYINCGTNNSPSWEIVSNIHNTANTTDGLSVSSIGGSIGVTWYWAGDYNGGYPKLRKFIPWKTIYFNAGTGVNRTMTSAQVPSDQALSYNISGATVTFFGGRTCVASNAGCCWSFTSWAFDGASTFTANSTHNVRTITFKYNSNIILQTYQNNAWTGDQGGDLSHLFWCGETMYVSFTSLRSGVYSKVTMSFNGISVAYTLKSSSQYYISGLKVNGTVITSDVPIHGTTNVELVFSLKQYTPSFQ